MKPLVGGLPGEDGFETPGDDVDSYYDIERFDADSDDHCRRAVDSMRLGARVALTYAGEKALESGALDEGDEGDGAHSDYLQPGDIVLRLTDDEAKLLRILRTRTAIELGRKEPVSHREAIVHAIQVAVYKPTFPQGGPLPPDAGGESSNETDQLRLVGPGD